VVGGASAGFSIPRIVPARPVPYPAGERAALLRPTFGNRFWW